MIFGFTQYNLRKIFFFKNLNSIYKDPTVESDFRLNTYEIIKISCCLFNGKWQHIPKEKDILNKMKSLFLYLLQKIC